MACAELYLGHAFYTETLERDLSRLPWPDGTRFAGAKELILGKEWVFMVCHPDIPEGTEFILPGFDENGLRFSFKGWNPAAPAYAWKEKI